MNRPRSISVALSAAFLALLASSAEAHAPPPMYLSAKLTEEKLDFTAVIGAELFKDWFGVDPATLKSPTEEQTARVRDLAQAFFREWAGVRVDGLPVRGVFSSAEFKSYEDHGIDWDFIHVTVSYGAKGRAREVALIWKKYDNSVGWYIEPVDGELYAYEGWASYSLTQKEPEYVWHAPLEERETTGLDRPGLIHGRRFSVPKTPPALYAMIGGTVLFVLLAVLFHFRPSSRRVAWPLLLLVAAGSLGSAWAARAEIRRPPVEEFVPPSAAEMKRVFAVLHRNVYRAFDYENEDDIYDTLSLSVSGDLLGEIYAEVFQSLILAEEGGAKCRIQWTKILDSEVSEVPESGGRRFRVDCTWRVRGRVGHYGHTHERVNQYHAFYEVTHLESGWKITDMDLLEQRRIDPDAEGGK